jgi:hypothetical protein
MSTRDLTTAIASHLHTIGATAMTAAEALDTAGAALGLPRGELAAELHCTAEALTMIRLCRAPRPGAEGVEDGRRVAARFGCDAGRLAAALGVAWD